MNMREISHIEKGLIGRFADKLPDLERQQLLADLEKASVQNETRDASSIIFQIAGYNRPPYQGQHSFGPEGRMLDQDGAELSVCLYADENGHLLELELIRWGSGDLLGPLLNTLDVWN